MMGTFERPYRTPPFPQPIELWLDGTEGLAPAPSLLEGYADPSLLPRYPDASALEAAIASRLSVRPESILVTAGADDALDRFCRAFLSRGDELIVPTPTFEMILRYARLAGASVLEIPWDGAFPLEAIVQAAHGATKAIAVVSPNNPTGATVSSEELARLAALGPKLLVDCAYGEFADEDLLPLAATLPNAIAFGTFSKAWGLAGLRVGFAAGPPKDIEAMRSAGAPYPVSSLSLAIALRWLEEGRAQVRAATDEVRRERRELAALLEELGVESSPSQANFLLARTSHAAWLRSCLAGLGVAVRSFPGRPGLEDALRVSLPGEPKQFSRLCAALTAALAPEALLLDLDGVLADVSRSYRRCIQETAASWGVPLSSEDIAEAKARGDANNDWVLTKRLLEERGVAATLVEVMARFEALYQGSAGAAGRWEQERLIGSAAQLARLAFHLPIGIVTGRPRADALRFLERFDLLPSISSLVCMEDAPPKPDPAPLRLALRELGVKRAWMVGDTPDDLRAAKAAGVIPFGVVAPGDERGATEERLLQAGAALVLGSLDELEEALEEIAIDRDTRRGRKAETKAKTETAEKGSPGASQETSP